VGLVRPLGFDLCHKYILYLYLYFYLGRLLCVAVVLCGVEGCDLGAAFVLPICRDLQNNLQIASIAAGAWNGLASVEYLYAAIARSVETRGSKAAVICDHVTAPDSRAQTRARRLRVAGTCRAFRLSTSPGARTKTSRGSRSCARCVPVRSEEVWTQFSEGRVRGTET
jgi:hypothetical protein